MQSVRSITAKPASLFKGFGILLLSIAFAASGLKCSANEPEVIRDLICDGDISQLTAIEDPSALQILTLLDIPDDEFRIDDNTLQSLRRFRRLRTLVLACPLMTDKGLQHIVELKHLECLIIYDGQFTDTGIQKLSGLPQVQIVGLHHVTGVSANGIETLKKALIKTNIDLGTFGKNTSLFDANGCLRPKILKPHLTARDNVRTPDQATPAQCKTDQ